MPLPEWAQRLIVGGGAGASLAPLVGGGVAAGLLMVGVLLLLVGLTLRSQRRAVSTTGRALAKKGAAASP